MFDPIQEIKEIDEVIAHLLEARHTEARGLVDPDSVTLKRVTITYSEEDHIFAKMLEKLQHYRSAIVGR